MNNNRQEFMDKVMKGEMPIYRLEWSELNQSWHFDNFTHEENTFGWLTVVEKEDECIISAFVDYIDKKYKPDTNNKKLTILKIKDEWDKYYEIIKGYIEKKKGFTAIELSKTL